VHAEPSSAPIDLSESGTSVTASPVASLGTTEQRFVMRARIVLAAADGLTNERIAAQLGVHRMDVLRGADAFCVNTWRSRRCTPTWPEPTYDRAARDRSSLHPGARRPSGPPLEFASNGGPDGISVTTVQRILRELA